MTILDRLIGVLHAVRLPAGYGLLALLSFPTLESLVFGQRGVGFAHDVFEVAGGVPRISATVTEWQRWGFSWWDPYFGTGNDLFAQHSIAPVAPDVLLGFVLGPFPAYVVTTWLMAAVAGLGMHLFLRDVLRLPPAARVVGSLVYLFGFWHYIYGFSAPAVPIVLWLTELALRPGPRRWRAIVGLVAVNAFVIYAGQSQVALIVGAVQLGWLLIAAADRGRVRDRLGLWVGSWALSLALLGPVLIAQLTWLPISERTVWNLADLYDARPLAALGAAVSFYSSLLFGVPVAPGIGVSPAHYGTYFAGVAGLVLLVIGAATALRRPIDRRLFAILLLLVAIPILDLAATLITPIQQNFGFLQSFQFVRIRHVMPFAVAALVAIGAGRVLRDDSAARARAAVEAIRTRTRWTPTTILSVLIGGLLAAAFAWQAVSVSSRLLSVVRRGQALVITDLGRVLFVLSAIAGLAAIAIVVGMLVRRRPLVGGVLIGVLLLVGFDRAAYAHAERFLNGSLGTWANDVAETPAQAFVQAQGPPELNRVLSLGLAGDRMGGQGIFQADGYQPIYPLGVHDLFGVLTAPYLLTDDGLYRYFHSWGVRAYAFGPGFDHEAADLMGIRWLIVRGGADPGPGWEPAFRSGSDVVYGNPTVMPRAFVASAIAPPTDREAIIDGLTAATRDQLAGTVFVLGEDRAKLGGIVPVATSGSTRPVSIASYAPDRQELEVPDGAAGVVVLTDATGPGWTATVDGVPAAVVPVDLAFRGVAVGPGAHRVVLSYRSAAVIGIGVLLIGALLTVGCAIVIRRRDRQALDDRR